MRCANIEECFEHISAYFDGERTGHFLLVNAENYDIYQEILLRLEADCSKICLYVSDFCLPNGLPDVDAAIKNVAGAGEYALIGMSAALMLQSDATLEAKIDEVLGRSISGHGVVLLDHCNQTLQKFLRRDKRVKGRVVLVDGEMSPLPQIKLAKSAKECIGYRPKKNFSELLAQIEHISVAQIEHQPNITVVTSISPAMFKQSVYSISPVADIYELIIKGHGDIAGATAKEYGSDAQWIWLATQLSSRSSFSALVCEHFGATANLSTHILDVMGSSNKNRRWLLWLSLKAFGEPNNRYLTYVLRNSDKYDDFELHVYMDLIDIDVSCADFPRLYGERKHLLAQFPENLPLITKYCERLGLHQKNAIFYLTDSSDREKYEFVRCLSLYEYSAEELNSAIHTMSKPLTLYMQDFTFDSANTKLPESDNNFRAELTSYFNAYKAQKLTNHIYPEFLEIVAQYATMRPYNKLQPRSSILSHMDKNNTQLFFFDSLGVEYLAFILAKCEEYGLIAEVSIGHCELPSITSMNKEFLQYFPADKVYKIDALDEMKHHSQIYDYQKCEYPLHLFEELDVIDEELRSIHSLLVQGTLDHALIVSDHGASRLAVRYSHESLAAIELDESGEHSGRCCPVEEDPHLPYAAYENDYSILANYERFKGGRRANVEVHGGASLEEVVVPVIMLTKRPDNIEICFTNSTITLKPHDIPELTLYSNISLQQPRLLIDGDFYDGEFVADKKHAKFVLPKIRRAGNYRADVYDGSKKMSITLDFKVQKRTREVDLF